MQNIKLCRLCMTQPVVSYSLLESDGANLLETLTSIKVFQLLSLFGNFHNYIIFSDK